MSQRHTSTALSGSTPMTVRVPRVLIVDDSKLQRRILSKMLSKLNYELVEAETGEAALASCAKDMPDLIISDWMMPGMSGIEFCVALREMAQEDYAYFILLTSKSEKAEVARGLDSGADDFLTKPVHKGAFGFHRGFVVNIK